MGWSVGKSLGTVASSIGNAVKTSSPIVDAIVNPVNMISQEAAKALGIDPALANMISPTLGGSAATVESLKNLSMDSLNAKSNMAGAQAAAAAPIADQLKAAAAQSAAQRGLNTPSIDASYLSGLQGFNYTPQQIQAALIAQGAVPNITAERIAAQPQIQAQQISGIQDVALGADSAFLGDQLSLVQALQAQANGTAGPSLAQLQLRTEQDRALRQQMALAASTGAGRNSAATQRQLLAQQAMSGQDLVRNAAMLRAQEQSAAQAQLASVLDQGRLRDVQRTQLELSAAQGNQSAQMELQRLNQAAALEAAKANQATGLSTAQLNQAAMLEAARANQSSNLAIAQANQAAKNTTSQFNVTSATNAADLNLNALKAAASESGANARATAAETATNSRTAATLSSEETRRMAELQAAAAAGDVAAARALEQQNSQFKQNLAGQILGGIATVGASAAGKPR